MQPDPVDPICDMLVDPAAPKGGWAEHRGVRYGFCNPRCKAKFEADPEGALAAPREDPVCGAPVPRATALFADDDGVRWYFHAPECRDRFLAEPARYTGEAPPTVLEGAASFDIGGMTCASCALNVQKALEALPAVEAASVNLATHRAAVRFRGAPDPAAVQRAVADAGYRAEPHREGGADPAAGEVAQARLRLLVAALFAAPLGVIAMAEMNPGPALRAAQAALGTLAVFVGGWSLLRTALARARHAAASMDTLVALGALAAWAGSVRALAVGGHLYFEVGALVIAFVLLGRWLEARARGRAGAALRALLDLAPRRARVLREGAEVEVPAAEVRPGDRLVVRPGEQVPADGRVREGRSSLDESLLTGESVPVDKAPGDPVAAGALNGAGALVVEATRAAADSTLAQIVRLVEQAQGSRAPVQRLADRVAAVFVPLVLLAAGLTLLGWRLVEGSWAAALPPAIAVLVIACPCALGLATPTAIVVGTGRAAGLGLLFRDAEALERLAAVTAVVLDKTGTLTRGKPRLVRVRALGALAPTGVATLSEDEALRLAAAAESRSEHPLARAVVEAARERGLAMPALEAFEARSGEGVLARADGRALRVGSPRWLLAAPAHLAALAELEAAGETVVALEADGAPAALLGILDPPRPEAAAAVARLRALGLTVELCTGDRAAPARAVAEAVGLGPDAVRSEVRPADKVARVKALRAEGAVVAMVGDGINDAPALAAADVGVALGAGTDVAREAGQVTLLRDDLRALPDAIALARATLRNIRQNLFWAFAYNLLALPLAALGLLERLGGPMLASAAMALSSVTVVSNALRLRRWAPTPPRAEAPGYERKAG